MSRHLLPRRPVRGRVQSAGPRAANIAAKVIARLQRGAGREVSIAVLVAPDRPPLLSIASYVDGSFRGRLEFQLDDLAALESAIAAARAAAKEGNK